MTQFSFLMVLVPIIGEQLLSFMNGETLSSGLGFLPLLMGFVGAFVSGVFACKVMLALVRKAKLTWFAIYCLVAALLIFIFA
jgi:undecaprenyl-diphosphatase